MVITLLISGFPRRMASLPRNTRTSNTASRKPRRMLRMRGVVSNTSPRRRSVMTRMRARAGKSRSGLSSSGLDTAVAFIAFHDFPQHRQTALRARTFAAQRRFEQRIIDRQLGAVRLRVPEVYDTRREASILAAHSRM